MVIEKKCKLIDIDRKHGDCKILKYIESDMKNFQRNIKG
jgi:hypothetical protein